METVCCRKTEEGELMPIGEIITVVTEVAKETSIEVARETKNLLINLDKPLNASEIGENAFVENDFDSWMNDLDKPLNSEQGPEGKETNGVNKEELTTDTHNSEEKETSTDYSQKPTDEVNTDEKHKPDGEKVEKMEPQISIEFTCPEGMDKKEFTRQLKAQERGLNSQTVAENMDNRAAFERRKQETGNGRDLSEGKKAQDIAREKATQSRIETNQKNGMSYSEAKAEAEEWIKTQAALHNPDQIAGGDPGKVSRMGDANVNSSIGSQWRSRVEQLSQGVEDFAKNKTREELENTKMNVKLFVA